MALWLRRTHLEHSNIYSFSLILAMSLVFHTVGWYQNNSKYIWLFILWFQNSLYWGGLHLEHQKTMWVTTKKMEVVQSQCKIMRQWVKYCRVVTCSCNWGIRLYDLKPRQNWLFTNSQVYVLKEMIEGMNHLHSLLNADLCCSTSTQ